MQLVISKVFTDTFPEKAFLESRMFETYMKSSFFVAKYCIPLFQQKKELNRFINFIKFLIN